MTNPEKVYDFLKSKVGRGLCDDCLGKRVAVDRHEVNTIASTLALFPTEFKRASAPCPGQCSGRDKLVTMAI